VQTVVASIAKARNASHRKHFQSSTLVLRHIGGESVLDNLALACQGCNNHKYVMTTATDDESDEDVPLFHPRQHRWEEYFRWDRSYTRVVGVTAIGRATISALQLNRTGLLNLRRVLHAVGEHPPAEVGADLDDS
jgi:hypothetical protein